MDFTQHLFNAELAKITLAPPDTLVITDEPVVWIQTWSADHKQRLIDSLEKTKALLAPFVCTYTGTEAAKIVAALAKNADFQVPSMRIVMGIWRKWVRGNTLVCAHADIELPLRRLRRATADTGELHAMLGVGDAVWSMLHYNVPQSPMYISSKTVAQSVDGFLRDYADDDLGFKTQQPTRMQLYVQRCEGGEEIEAFVFADS